MRMDYKYTENTYWMILLGLTFFQMFFSGTTLHDFK